MGEFPRFMRNPANRIAAASEHTRDVEGYLFDGVEGSQAALWTSRSDAVSREHTHDFDEYVFVLEGRCTIVLDGKRMTLAAGQELHIAAGTRQTMAVTAGTRTLHVFGGPRARREGAPPRRTRQSNVASVVQPDLEGSLDGVVVVRCTGRLLKELGVKPMVPPPELDPNAEWHATLIRFGGREGILFGHTKTLYCTLTWFKRSELGRLGELFAARAHAALAADGIPLDVVAHAAVLPSQTPRLVYAKTNNRSVVGSLRELAFLLDGDLGDPRGGDMAWVNRRLNRVPMIGTLGGDLGVAALRSLLGLARRNDFE